MTCTPAAVVDRYGKDVAEHFGIPYVFNQPGPGGVFLGSVGDQSHHGHASSHNCAPNPQESPVNGVSYDPNHAHAYDARPINHEVGMKLVRATLADGRVRYVNYDNVRYYPDGHTDDPIDHPTFHVSFLPGTTNDTRPFFTDGGDEVTPEDIQKINKGTAIIVGANTAKVIEANRHQTAVLRRAIWNAAGMDVEEVKRREKADPIEEAPSAARLVHEALDEVDKDDDR